MSGRRAKYTSQGSTQASRRASLSYGCVLSGALLLLGSGGCSGDKDAPNSATGDGGSAPDPGATTGGQVGSSGGATGGAADGQTGGSATAGGANGTGGTDGSGGEDNVPGAGGLGSGGVAMDGSGGSGATTGAGGVSDGGSGGSNTGGSNTGGSENDDPLSPGCGTAFSPPPPSNQQQTLEIEGDTRYYLMDVPDGADNQTPLMLIFALHGFDMNNIAVVDLFNFTERSNGQAITVWPQGEGPHPGDTPHWGDQVLQSTWSANNKNYSFLREIMTDLGERYCIDQNRIFIAGFSMGGFFTNQLACDHSDWFRGFAPVAGGGPQACASNAENAIMIQHGTADDIVALSSGEGSRDHWLEQNGCGQTSTKSLNNCDFYDGCPESSPVAWCTGSYDHYIPNEVASNIWSFFSSL